MSKRKVKSWLLIGAGEIILALTLIAIAPNFLNSKKPFWGFMIWLTVPTVLGCSSIYTGRKLFAAHQARKIFVTAFPEYSNLEVSDFLELSPAHVASQIDLLRSVQATTEVQELNISLFEVLEQTKNEQIEI